MKSFIRVFICLGLLVFIEGCKDSETVKVDVCLPTQFPLEEEDGEVTVIYDTKNRINNLTYIFEGEGSVFKSVHFYDNGKINFINFYVNGYLADDFVKVRYDTDTVREDYFRTSDSPANLQSYRKYYLTDEKISGYSEFDASDDFARADSVIFEYTNGNVTKMKHYNNAEMLEATIELEFDDKTNPYFETGFSGSEYLFSYLNLSVNNPIKQTKVELGETIEYAYTYDDKGFPLTRTSTLAISSGEFLYSCDN